MNAEILIELTEQPIDPSHFALQRVNHEIGAIVEFDGVVRASEDGTNIRGIEYEAFHAMALEQLRIIAQEIAEQHALAALVCVHRIGFVANGETAMYVRVCCGHRAEAFAACMAFIDRVKQDVPIWKHPVE